MATNRVLQLLRSNSIYESFSDAKSHIEALTEHKDGEILLARYISGQTAGENPTNTYETAIGVYSSVTDSSKSMAKWTVFKSSTELDARIAELQSELNATQTGAGLSENGAYAAPTEGNAGYEIISGGTAATNLNDAINKVADYVYDTIQAMDYTLNVSGATDSNTTLTTADASKVVTAVNQTDGKIAAGTTAAKDLLLTGYTKDTTATGSIAATDTIEGALSKLENTTSTGVKLSGKSDNQITRLENQNPATDDGLYSHVELVEITGQDLTALGTNVKEAYKLQANGADITTSAPIKIYKDSSLKEVYLGANTDTINATSGEITKNTVTDPQSMNFAYQLADGTYELVKIDVSKFLTQSEFGDGLTVSGAGVVSVNAGNGLEIDSTSKAVNVKINSTNDTNRYLSVGANGVALNGNAIDEKIANAKTTITEVAAQSPAETTPDGNKFIKIVKTAGSGSTPDNYAISTQGINDAIAVETTRAQNAEGELATVLGATGVEGSRVWTPTTNYGSSTTNAQANMAAIDAKVKEIEDGFVESVDVASGETVISVDNTDTQNPKISFNLSQQSASTAADASYAGGATSNILRVKSDGLYLDSTWDCGVY